ncbi:MAG: fatty acid hydroxylase [Herminiimonas sp.]|nr:fatty acid hydroxylase [Herminiimonas sp.]
MGVSGGTLAWLMSSVIDSNAVFALFATVVGQYLVYETFHYCCHVHKNWSAFKCASPISSEASIRLHHNKGIIMKYNMNLTFRIADWVMGRSDLRRGLLGRLFGGYAESQVKRQLRPLISRFRTIDERVTIDGPRMTAQAESVMSS